MKMVATKTTEDILFEEVHTYGKRWVSLDELRDILKRKIRLKRHKFSECKYCQGNIDAYLFIYNWFFAPEKCSSNITTKEGKSKEFCIGDKQRVSHKHLNGSLASHKTFSNSKDLNKYLKNKAKNGEIIALDEREPLASHNSKKKSFL